MYNKQFEIIINVILIQYINIDSYKLIHNLRVLDKKKNINYRI